MARDLRSRTTMSKSARVLTYSRFLFCTRGRDARLSTKYKHAFARIPATAVSIRIELALGALHPPYGAEPQPPPSIFTWSNRWTLLSKPRSESDARESYLYSHWLCEKVLAIALSALSAPTDLIPVLHKSRRLREP